MTAWWSRTGDRRPREACGRDARDRARRDSRPTSTTSPPEPQFPDGFRDWSPAEAGNWWKQFYKTDDGKRYNRLTTAYAVKINTDGSFRIEDVPAGRYQLNFVHSMKSLDLAENGLKEVTTILAECRSWLEVPADPGDRPIDAGELTLTRREPAPVDR